ncbi:MAG TPA: PQQ-binding-like beta-propeller repeat protein, partial [Herpetosiphonaceae bacterium]
ELLALDSASGAERWRTPFAGGWLSVRGATLYAEPREGLERVDAYDAATGALRWSHAGSLAAADARSAYLLIGDEEALALDSVTGAERWSRDWADPRHDAMMPGALSTPGMLAAYRFGLNDGNFEMRLNSVDPLTGAERWRATLLPTPAGDSMSFDLLSLDNRALLVQIQAEWFWLDAATGELRLVAYGREARVSDGTVYLLGFGEISALGWREP